MLILRIVHSFVVMTFIGKWEKTKENVNITPLILKNKQLAFISAIKTGKFNAKQKH